MTHKCSVLVTGATGFVGRPLCQYLADQGYQVFAGVRDPKQIPAHPQIQYVELGSLGQAQCLKLPKVTVCVHLAARVHQMTESAQDPLLAFRQTNVLGTRQLLDWAVEQPIKRFIFLSTIKVNGTCTFEHAFKPTDAPQPQDPYAQSKWEAEQQILKFGATKGLEWCIIRPPLIYGPHAKGHFAQMLKWLKFGVPLPFKRIHNVRSLVSVSNVISLIETCLQHPKAKNQTFLVSDGQDWSTPALMRECANALNQPLRLFTLPYWFNKGLFTLIGKSAQWDRLNESLQVDISKTQRLLNWSPTPFSLSSSDLGG